MLSRSFGSRFRFAAVRGRRRTGARLGAERLEGRRVLAAEPALVADINAVGVGSDPENLVTVGNVIFFTAVLPGTGRELWKTDGTTAGTVLVKDIIPGRGASEPLSLTALAGTLFFTAA